MGAPGISYPLVVNGKSALQFIRAHLEELHALLEVDVGVMMFVEGR